ncbi:MAG: iron ABC transporter permease [Acidovorax sp.]|uniref:FecCD family ABC transporter permease n=1 Tax=Acidovorax sp. TaxID=1872122 RepID=UPI0022C3B8CC|nr:iron ABC transporter permease [Acidovorax sp.]MCZ8217840.1 iron ABC transporter permease [Acidovorax sp.]
MSSVAVAQPGARWSPGRLSPRAALAIGAALVGLSFVWASTRGAYAIAPAQLWQVLLQAVGAAPSAEQAPEYLVFINIRLPRLLMGVAAGAGLGLAGALMQGLFRNPLADPGLVGVSSGAALAAAATIVLGSHWLPDMPRTLGSWALVGTAFGGGLLVTALIYALAQADGGTRMGLMLLAGVAVNALALSGLGYLNFISTDEQLRNLQMWLLGSLGGARWSAVLLVSGVVAAACALGLALARPLNAIALGEAQAALLGVPVERTKRLAVLVTALAVGAVTAATGIIGFIGLVAPHWVRLVAGPDHRVVLPGAALLGAALVLVADGVARTIVQPAELPLGVLTAFIGVPLFLAMLRQFRSKV